MSTIYWNPWPILMKHVFEFYTSDLPGNYRIRLEGVAENGDLFYGEKMITVREK